MRDRFASKLHVVRQGRFLDPDLKVAPDQLVLRLLTDLKVSSNADWPMAEVTYAKAGPTDSEPPDLQALVDLKWLRRIWGRVAIGLELQATQILFNSIGDFPGHEENIERFCLPLFTKVGSEYAIQHVLGQLARRPSMTQIYAAYLQKFVANSAPVREALVEALDDKTFFDWQQMWLLATLMQAGEASDRAIRVAMSLLMDANRHDALRAAAALFVGRYGGHDRRKALFGIYTSVSDYVQLAIYFSSRNWPAVERKNARDSWGGHGPLHKLMSKGLAASKN